MVRCRRLHAGRQREYGVGASVYDRSQAASKRGYGTISEAGDPGRWRVAWQEAGLRSCVISEPYLELALVHHSQRVVPTAMKQAVVVVLGTHKGKAGTTIKRVRAGQRAWSARPAAHAIVPHEAARRALPLPPTCCRSASSGSASWMA